MMSRIVKPVLAVCISFLMVGLAFAPLTPMDPISTSDDSRHRMVTPCQGTECKVMNPDAALLYGDMVDIRTSPEDNSRAASNKYAVLAGVSDYPGSSNDLSYCDDDVYDTRNTLISLGWTSNNIHTLIDSEATNQNILDELDWMEQQEDENSQVYFHFSGHGTSGQFLTYGGTMTDDTLAGAFNGFESGQIVIVMDTCHAGSFTSLNRANTIGIMACQSNQYSYDGMFTPVFMDQFTDSTVSVESAFTSARSSVNSQTGGSQTPLMWDNVGGSLLLGNMPPVIGNLPLFETDEDSPLQMDLTPYESDEEDTGTDLEWRVSDYDAGIIISIEGQQSSDDVITLYPSTDFTGSTSIELTLMDSMGESDVAQATVNWNPVNDAPEITNLGSTSRSVKRTEEVTLLVSGTDVDDSANDVDVEVEVRHSDVGSWEPLESGSTYVSGKWNVEWTPGPDLDLGDHDFRARLVDDDDLMSDWKTRQSLIDVLNNRPKIISLQIPSSEMERLSNMTVSVYPEDLEDDLGGMTLEIQYQAPGQDFITFSGTSIVDDHFEIDFTPGIECPLGWYNMRARVLDSDEGQSSWFYENASVKVKNSRPHVTSIEPVSWNVTRESELLLEMKGQDPEDSKINLMAEAQYGLEGTEWTDISDGIEFSSGSWWISFRPAIDAPTGDYYFRARLTDTAGATSDWYMTGDPVSVQNNLPAVSQVLGDVYTVKRTEEIELRVSGADVEDESSQLILEGEMSTEGSENWDNRSIDEISFHGARDDWSVKIVPGPRLETGRYDVRFRLIDTEDGTGQWHLMEEDLVVENSPPVVDLVYPDPVNENTLTTFDATNSWDPEGGSLEVEWDFGDTRTADGLTTTHRYGRYGTYTLEITVLDRDGAEVTRTVDLSVNALPVGKVSTVQEGGIGNFRINFDSSGSTDPDGRIVSYKWDLDLSKDTDGDGDPANDVDSTGSSPSMDYGEEGEYTYKLTLVDDKGAKSEVIDDVSVSSMTLTSMGLIGGISLIIIAVVVSAVLLGRKKRKRKGGSNSPPQQIRQVNPDQQDTYSLVQDDGQNLY